MQAVLVINAGSTSLKFSVYQLSPALPLQCAGQVQGLLDQPAFEARDGQGRPLAAHGWPGGHGLSHAQALQFIIGWLPTQFEALELQAAAHRIVHGGERFDGPVRLDGEVLDYLDSLSALEPSHQPLNVAAARALAQAYPGITQIGCFDTAFHHHLPERARRYAVAPALEQAGLRHWGFHGISYDYLSRQVARHWPGLRRLIVMHLGGGASVCAIEDGRSLDTSMGFGALSGLPMATRCGDLPPEGLLYLLRSRRFEPQELERLLFQHSGLLGLSQRSDDMRALEAQCEQQPQARFAIEAFVYALRKYVGAYAAVLGGVDALVFSAGIGEHSAKVRADLCRGLGWLGVVLDEAANQRHERCISTPDSPVRVLVLPTDEDEMMAQQALGLLTPAGGPAA